MKPNPILLGTFGLSILVSLASASTLYVDLNSTNPTPPYADWSTAATNIQDAIDAANEGDQIWVTNGVYQTGGKIMAGNLTNRVALDKAVTVQSVNGPFVTIIQGSHTSNGAAAVRCAWLTNNAALIGFTLMWGATQTSGDTGGGGVKCASSNAVVANCVIVSNTASQYGGGAYQGTLNNCLIYSNNASGPGGGACNVALINCTVISNANFGIYQTPPNLVRATNCLVYFNGNANYAGGTPTFAYCCTTPAVTGSGNFTSAPQLFVDDIHLANGSPCIGAGTNVATGTDIFGNTWSNPPSVGCAEWQEAPFVTKPQIQLIGDPVGFTIGTVAIDGEPPFTGWWLKDGTPLQDNGHFSSTQTTNLVAVGVSLADAGDYQLVVSNAFGVVTSAVATLTIHCVDVAGANPIAPYSTWATAATNIQDAIDASAAGDIVLVTNGVYATGGKSMDGVITNRVSVDKAIMVKSVNGPDATVIQGAWDLISTNGLGAVRCAWLTTNATLSGFTLRGGATRTYPGSPNGGGVFGNGLVTAPPTNSIVANCVLEGNSASSRGGGAYDVTLISCTLTGNSTVWNPNGSGDGGGAFQCYLKNCVVTGNSAFGNGGGVAGNSVVKNCAITQNRAIYYGSGVDGGALVNCTLTGNLAGGYASQSGAVANANLINCIVYGNLTVPPGSYINYYNSTFSYSDTDPLPAGTGNLDVDPQLLADGIHLAATSPCLGAGTTNNASGTDIDGQPWNRPPAVGCDEWQPAPVIAAQPTFQIESPAHGLTFNLVVAGQSPFNYSWSQNGLLLHDDGHHSNSSTASLIVNNFGPDDAGLYQVVVSNTFGVVTSQVAQVVIHAVNVAGTNPVPPFSTWATAATNIQAAIDGASAGDIVLVTNGVYTTGGKVMAGDLTNRVVLDKALIVTSVNGYSATVIQGAWDPTSMNGPGAVRCAWLTNGAVLDGFTLQDGATRATGDVYSGGPLESGGGVWCSSTNGIVSNCLLTNNSAIYGGGLAYGALNNSLAVKNQAAYGGGAYHALLNNCTVNNNYCNTSTLSSRGAYRRFGAGGYDCIARNSILLNNFSQPFTMPIYSVTDNYDYDTSNSGLSPSLQFVYCCTDPLILNTGDIDANPQFLDMFHLAATSSCRGAGSALYASGTDLDGEPWLNPPSMGCDEVVESNLVGPLSVALSASQTNVLVNRNAFFWGSINGRAASVAWSFGDGTTVTNSGGSSYHQWPNAGDYTVTFTAYNNGNLDGVSSNIVIHVLPLETPQLQFSGVPTNGFQFQFAGQVGVNYTIQYATNLTPPVAWQTLQTIYYNTANTNQITDPAGTNTVRFYRVLAQ